MSQQSNIGPYEVYNCLTGEWAPLISPQRASRPWQGKREKVDEPQMSLYDPTCYLCPGNIRNTGDKNPQYTKTYAFQNDFGAILPETTREHHLEIVPFIQKRKERGLCEVLCYSPRHDLTMTHMSHEELIQVIVLWKERYLELGKLPYVHYIQIFENRGKEMGASNPHPHGQLWAQEHIPVVPAKELKQQEKYLREKGKNLLVDYIETELHLHERIVHENKDFVILIVHWATWPYETMIVPKVVKPSIAEFSDGEIKSLATSISVITKTYAKLFERPKYGIPYTLGIHQKPTDGDKHPEAQFHIHFEPPFLTPDRLKYMVGYERFSQAQRDVTPEYAAKTLREIASKI